MKKRVIGGILGLVLIAGLGFADDLVPVAVSPGSENGPAMVRQTCPTFSWTAVSWALTYKVVVFEDTDRETPAYEKIAESASPVLVKEIPGKAFAWTPSADEALLNGGSYIWYVGAMVNASQGQWSEGRRFIVEENQAWGAISEPREKANREADSREILRDKDLKITAAAEEKFNLKDDPAGLELDNIQGTEGISNTFFGAGAGNTTMTGAHNSFFGYLAGNKNANGSSNTFIGRAAGYGNSSGGTNTFVGHAAGQNNSTASANTFLGYATGYATTIGSYNVFVGKSAGKANTDGSRNTFLGNLSGTSNTRGIYNTFVGEQAGLSNLTGSHNTFIGEYAGINNQHGHLNVFLGSMAGYGEKGSNKLYIDNNSDVSPLIYGEFDNSILNFNAKLRINTSATITVPTHLLDVGTNGAYCNGGAWVDGSSREYKENIEELTTEEARQAFEKLEPVKFSYKEDKGETYLGFIAEDVPDLVAMNDRKGLSPMDLVAMLTKVVQEQQKAITELQKKIAKLEKKSRKTKPS